jgi:CubicO group peptidase (beta-lactamase class C family)
MTAFRSNTQSFACGEAADIADGWTISAPETVGLDSRELCRVIEWLDGDRQLNVHSVLVVRRGALVFEHYRKGADDHWGSPLPDARHGPELRHDLRSATKSVTGLLIGLAHERKLIPSLDEPVFQYFPDYVDLRTPEKDRILLQHLLTMSAGLDWDENVPISDPRHGEARMWRSGDRLHTALEPRMVAAPGLNWNYSGGCTELLGAVLCRAVGKPIDDFARESLFDPLGITDVEWARYDNSPSASGGLCMRSRDLAKIGQLVVSRGQWRTRQIVSNQWIDDSIAPHIGAADRLYFYGYHWWLGRSLLGRREIAWAAAVGYGGQRLFVVPALELAVVITAGHYADAMQGWVPLVILNRYVLPAVKQS